jgi:hypothetical protein
MATRNGQPVSVLKRNLGVREHRSQIRVSSGELTTKENAMPDMSSTRDWDKKDEYNDRGVTERPVSQEELSQNNTQVDAVPGLWYRPGRRN